MSQFRENLLPAAVFAPAVANCSKSLLNCGSSSLRDKTRAWLTLIHHCISEMSLTCIDGLGATDDAPKFSDKSTKTLVGGSFPLTQADMLKKGIQKKKKEKKEE